MAATSHDFWLHNLSPYVWKSLHMGVYVAYGLLVLHVLLGVVQLAFIVNLVWSLARGARVVVSSRPKTPFAAALARSTGRPFVAVGPTDRLPWYLPPKSE